MDWLAGLPSGEGLQTDELRRVRSLLPRYPERIWNECGHWLNLEGEWTPTEELGYSLTMQALVPWKHLFKPVKQKTADLQKLSADVCQQHPFSTLRSLAHCVEDRFQEQLFDLPEPSRKPWLTALGNGLRRVELDDDGETSRVRQLANRLATTGWQVATGLETVPYVDDTPAGTPRRIDVLWKDGLLYVEDRSAAKMARSVSLELGRVFGRQEIADAIKLCYDRSPEFVTECLEENFTLAPAAEVEALATEPVPVAAASTSSGEQPHNAVADTGAGGEDRTEAEFDAEAAGSFGDGEPERPGEDLGDSADDFDDTSLDNDELDTETEHAPVTPPKPRSAKPAKPSLLERFARAGGYVKDGDERFYHPNGGWIERVGGHTFPWERRSASGELLRCYWPKDHCIKRDPLQLDADVWELCKNHPDKYALLLADGDDTPIEITGAKLTQMCEGGELTLYPAKYRLVYSHDVKGSDA